MNTAAGLRPELLSSV